MSPRSSTPLLRQLNVIDFFSFREVGFPMELTLKRGDFLNELSLMQGVVERKNTIPILSNILLKASDGDLDGSRPDAPLFRRRERLPARRRDGAGAKALRPDPEPSGGRREAEADGEPLPGRHVSALELPPGCAARRGLSDRPESRGEGRNDVSARGLE